MMKKIILFVAIVGLAVGAASAQVRFGVTGGLNINELKFNDDLVQPDNRVGWNAGATLDITLPIVGLGLDASALYSHIEGKDENNTTMKRNYLSVPVNVKWKFSVPVVSPFIFTGPEVNFLLDNDKDNDNHYAKTVFCWNVGAGVELFSKLQVKAAYNMGVSKSVTRWAIGDDATTVGKGKDKSWNISATLFF